MRFAFEDLRQSAAEACRIDTYRQQYAVEDSMQQSSPRPNENIYRKAAAVYDLHTPGNQAEIVEFIERTVADRAVRGRRTIEFACGTGRIAIPLAQRGFDVVGTDASEAMLRICAKKAAERSLKLELRHEWMQDFAEVDAYDIEIAILGAIAFLVDLKRIREFLRNCFRGLRAGGLLILDVPNSLDGLVKPWSGTTVGTFSNGEFELKRFLQQVPDPLLGISEYRDTGIVRSAAGTEIYEEIYTLRLFSLSLLEVLLEGIGFAKSTCYCKWGDVLPMQRPADRLILVLEK
jgi:2-polyprenyl-3-methyl-5-hydroxy-6-metoxy-1,4-benzoquinol methylase